MKRIDRLVLIRHRARVLKVRRGVLARRRRMDVFDLGDPDDRPIREIDVVRERADLAEALGELS